MIWLILFINFVLASAAWANVPQDALDNISVDAEPGASFPMSLHFADIDGVKRSLAEVVSESPAVIVFSDYTCTNLCGPILSFVAAGLSKSGLLPGRDFHLIVIGLDPKDGAREAAAMKAAHFSTQDDLAKASVFLIGNAPAIETATKAVGYHYLYDKEHDQFAHPAAAYVITQKGIIVRVLSGLGLAGDDLRLALVDAGQGRIGTLLDQIKLHCFGFDPVRGIYTASITKILTIACIGTFVLLLGGVCFLVFGKPKRAAQ
jgi:protein SCO1